MSHKEKTSLFFSAVMLVFGLAAWSDARAHETTETRPLCEIDPQDWTVTPGPRSARVEWSYVHRQGETCVPPGTFHVRFFKQYTQMQEPAAGAHLRCLFNATAESGYDTMYPLLPSTYYWVRLYSVHDGGIRPHNEDETTCHWVHYPKGHWADHPNQPVDPPYSAKTFLTLRDGERQTPPPTTPPPTATSTAPTNAQICRALDLLGQIVCNNHKGYGDCLADGTWDHSFGRDVCPAF